MANIKSAKKRARQAEERRQHNASMRSRMRSGLKKVINAIEAGDKAKAEEAYKAAVPYLDRMSTKGMISKNKAARHKSRLNTRLKDMAS
ncbi:small subunit ribosomal protein S20 [Natronospira proteinivora]|uniref:Small ribosomal subunit protein bS20 n=1 Tax=Natronospira proteinivora TaxID=1807133 RepID=A0ABT1G8C9_9GAMM|nr:30S ribosomal protein S20 [Natronospira proteinivora]MCP1726217.1 small subunit ribosomal protein S20 [Natronospira proteinivora]